VVGSVAATNSAKPGVEVHARQRPRNVQPTFSTHSELGRTTTQVTIRVTVRTCSDVSTYRSTEIILDAIVHILKLEGAQVVRRVQETEICCVSEYFEGL